MDRRGFLGKGALAAGAAGAAVGAAGTAAFGRKLMQPPPLRGKVSYAQQGEDLVLWQMARTVLRIERPTYLDIGAHHPITGSNTYLFYERGSRGVLVEPNPALHGLLAAERPDDKLLRAGIGVTSQREADYYVIGGAEDGGLNTFSQEQANALATRSGGRYRIERVLKLPLLDINAVMQEHWGRAPNVLSVDTEGFDLPILRSLDFARFRPDLICAETLEHGGRRVVPDIARLLTEKGYEVRGGSFVNTIFLDRRHA